MPSKKINSTANNSSESERQTTPATSRPVDATALRPTADITFTDRILFPSWAYARRLLSRAGSEWCKSNGERFRNAAGGRWRAGLILSAYPSGRGSRGEESLEEHRGVEARRGILVCSAEWTKSHMRVMFYET